MNMLFDPIRDAWTLLTTTAAAHPLETVEVLLLVAALTALAYGVAALRAGADR